MRRIRSTDLALAAAAALIAHQLGYGIAGAIHAGGLSPDHSHLSILLGIALPLATLAAGVLLLRSLRSQLEHPGFRRLVGLQVALFSALELYEYGAAGEIFAAFSNPAVWLGLLAQPLVAWIVDRILVAGSGALEQSEGTTGILIPQPEVGVVAPFTPLAVRFDRILRAEARAPPR